MPPAYLLKGGHQLLGVRRSKIKISCLRESLSTVTHSAYNHSVANFWEKVGWAVAKRALDAIFKKKKKEEPAPKSAETKDKDKTHPWRLCPRGKHWVVTHPLTVPVSEKNPDGETTRRGHCHGNPGKQEILQPEELHEIAEAHAAEASPKPTPYNFGSAKGNQYDTLIALWTQFWNETFQPTPYLDPDIVKALMASESSSRKDIATPNEDPDVGYARGLIQITDQTRSILKDPKGELKDFHIPLNRSEVNNPNLNLAAGIRWLFYKRDRASAKLGHQASWEEAVMEYKGITRDLKRNNTEAIKQRNNFNNKFDLLKKARK